MNNEEMQWASNIGSRLVAGHTVTVNGNVTGCYKNINGRLVSCSKCANCWPGLSKKEYKEYYEILKEIHGSTQNNNVRHDNTQNNNVHEQISRELNIPVRNGYARIMESDDEETRKRKYKDSFDKKQQNTNYKVPKNDKTYH